MLNDCITEDDNSEVAMCAQFFEASSQVPPTLAKVKELGSDDKPSFGEKHASKVELKLSFFKV